jgi:hypothetical protein
MSSATQNDNLLPVTGFEGYAAFYVNTYDADPVVSLGDGVSITGTCSVKIDLWGVGEEATFGAISSGNYTSEIVGSYSGGIDKVQGGRARITGGTFSGRVFVGIVTGGNFSGLTDPGQIGGTAVCETTATVTLTVTIDGGVFNCPVTLAGVNVNIQAGTFNGPVTINKTFGNAVTGGTFNSSFTQTAGNVTGGTFNGSYTQTSGNISGGIFDCNFTRVSGNVTGGTFNNAILNQFYRNGWPPPLVFTGRQYWFQ